MGKTNPNICSSKLVTYIQVSDLLLASYSQRWPNWFMGVTVFLKRGRIGLWV